MNSMQHFKHTPKKWFSKCIIWERTPSRSGASATVATYFYFIYHSKVRERRFDFHSFHIELVETLCSWQLQLRPIAAMHQGTFQNPPYNKHAQVITIPHSHSDVKKKTAEIKANNGISKFVSTLS